VVNIEKVERLRIQHGYTQEQIAIMMGYQGDTSYNSKAKGKRQFTVEDVVKLCGIFQLEPNDLIKW
jgi:transcriptional regulator with XRE-family HTH domain